MIFFKEWSAAQKTLVKTPSLWKAFIHADPGKAQYCIWACFSFFIFLAFMHSIFLFSSFIFILGLLFCGFLILLILQNGWINLAKRHDKLSYQILKNK